VHLADSAIALIACSLAASIFSVNGLRIESTQCGDFMQ